MSDVKIIPISNEYRENYERIFHCSRCLDRGVVVYGSDNYVGTYSVKCGCVNNGVDEQEK